MFPYPSGDGLHVGHVRSNTAMDIIARKRRAEGYNVLYPIGWDAFGLPTENYAIKTGMHPRDVTKKNTDIFRRQLKAIGFSFDWSREVNTTDPEYYKWTQWMFLQFYKHGLAYKKKMPINWCVSCKIGLANEEVVDGKCERCGGETEIRDKEQWMLAITKYAKRLIEDLDGVDFLEKIKIQQKNWIGRSEGAIIKFQITNLKLSFEVFTTRPDTLFGATYCVLSPEHKLIDKLKDKIENWDEVQKYIRDASVKSEIERTAEDKEKSGVELKGFRAVNPANNKELPIFIADYVLAHYGTGAIMAVPAHDDRDYAFAKKLGLKIVEVISGGDTQKCAYIGDGKLINSGKFDGTPSEEAKHAITEFVGGKTAVKYKLRDWVFSRQRYWGEPIPIIHCDKCGIIPVKESELPVELPDVKSYEPTDTGESPLATIEEWVNVNCPECGCDARRETDTMPNWAGSSWYFLRYIDSNNDKYFADKEKLLYWMPVDWYNGGMEHTTLHLLYSRFWIKFLHDIGLVPANEPYKKRTSHGMILAEGGVKMSKSKGNVINPDDIIKNYGADTLRIYEMFIGPFDQAVVWSTDSIIGPRRFLEKVWRLQEKLKTKNEKGKTAIVQSADGFRTIKNLKLESLLHQTIKKVSDDIEGMRFNTAISQMMVLVNEMEKEEQIFKGDFEALVKILSPFAPHISEELWSELGHDSSIHLESWPEYNAEFIKEESFELVVQINGKVRGKIEVPSGLSEDKMREMALNHLRIKEMLEGESPKKIIIVPGRLVNIVI